MYLEEIQIDYGTVERLANSMVIVASQQQGTVSQTCCAAALILARIFGQSEDDAKEIKFIQDVMDYAGLYFSDAEEKV